MNGSNKDLGGNSSARLKRQTLLVLIFGLFLGSALVFTAVWSGTKQHLEQKKQEELDKLEGSKNQAEDRPISE